MVTGHFLRMHAMLLLTFGCCGAALGRFDRILQLRPLDCHALASRAHIYAQRGSFDKAVESLGLLTQTYPQESSGWFNLGYALQQLGQQGQAGVAFRCALAIEPRMDRAWYGLALALMDSRQFQEAADALEENIALQPMSPYGWFSLAQVRQALDQHDEAFRIALHLREFEPKVAALLERVLGLERSGSPYLDGPAARAVITPAIRHAA